MIEQRYLSVKETAVYLGVSTSAVRKWIRLDTIPLSRFNGSIRFDKYRLDSWASK